MRRLLLLSVLLLSACSTDEPLVNQSVETEGEYVATGANGTSAESNQDAVTENEPNSQFEIIQTWHLYNRDYYIMHDNKTGCQYMVIEFLGSHAGGISMEPYLEDDGTTTCWYDVPASN